MAKIISKINPRSQDFLENAEHMQVQVDDLKEKLKKIKRGGVKRVESVIYLVESYYLEIVSTHCLTLDLLFLSFHSWQLLMYTLIIFQQQVLSLE